MLPLLASAVVGALEGGQFGTRLDSFVLICWQLILGFLTMHHTLLRMKLIAIPTSSRPRYEGHPDIVLAGHPLIFRDERLEFALDLAEVLVVDVQTFPTGFAWW